MIRSKAELIQMINEISLEENAIALVEDLSDTIDALESEKDAIANEWKEKYCKRFAQSTQTVAENSYTYNNLFN